MSVHTMEGNFRTLLRKFCLESSILGLKYFYLYPDIISRCFWLVNIVAALSLACLLSWLLYFRFAEMPTRVTIENQFESLQNLPFPSVTICSPNQVTASFMAHFNRTLVDGNLKIDLEQVLPKLLGFYENVRGNISDDMSQLQSLLKLNRYTVSEIMAAIPQSCDDFLKRCFFNNIEQNCSSIFQPILTANGLCCTFNNIYHYHDKRNEVNRHFVLKNVTHVGFRRGLVVVTDYNPENAVDGTVLNAGAAKVLYTDHSEFPTNDESYLVEPAVESFHLIRATYTYCSEEVQSLPAWSRKCFMEDERHLPYFHRYHNSDCDLTCYAAAVKDYCNCTLLFMPGILQTGKICNLTKIPCIMDVRLRMSQWMNGAQCECPRDCVSRQYKVDMTTGNLDALSYMIVNLFEGIKFNESTTIMTVYFPNSVYVKQKQETVMSLITLASNLGGVFGLCLGCSGVSILEVFFYMSVAVRSYFKRKIRRTHKVKNSRSWLSDY